MSSSPLEETVWGLGKQKSHLEEVVHLTEPRMEGCRGGLGLPGAGSPGDDSVLKNDN